MSVYNRLFVESVYLYDLLFIFTAQYGQRRHTFQHDTFIIVYVTVFSVTGLCEVGSILDGRASQRRWQTH